MEAELKRVPGAREVQTIGGPGRVVQVTLDPSRLRERGVDLLRLKQTLAAANLGMPVGLRGRRRKAAGRMLAVETGEFLRSADDVGDLVVGVHQAGRSTCARWREVEAGAASRALRLVHARAGLRRRALGGQRAGCRGRCTPR
jgi:multidrug efflux pump subunit AcrB